MQICKGGRKSEEKQQGRNDDKRNWENDKMSHLFFLFNTNESISWWNIHVSFNERNVLNVSPNSEQHTLSQAQDVVVSSSWERFVFGVYVLWTVRFCTIGHRRTRMTNTPPLFRQSINSLSLYWRNQTSIDRGRAVNDWNKVKWAITNQGDGEPNLGAENRKVEDQWGVN